MNFEEIKKWLEENKEDAAVIAYLNGFSKSWINSDDGKKFLESDEGKSLYQAEIDRRITGALSTYKEKTLPDLVKEKTDELMAKFQPKETPEQKRIRELEDKDAQRTKELKDEKLSKIALKTLTHKKLNSLEEVAELFLGEDEVATLENIEKVSNAIDEIVKAELKKAFPDREIIDTDITLDANTPNPWKKGSPDYNLTEQGKIFRDEPAKAKQLMKLAAS